MSAAQHTPGPWLRDRESGFECDVRASNGRRIAAVNVQNPPKTKQQFDGRKAENEANARLIAAAPELLDAHEPDREGPGFLDWVADRLVIQHGEHEGSDFILCLRRRAALARAAIAKATTTP